MEGPFSRKRDATRAAEFAGGVLIPLVGVMAFRQSTWTVFRSDFAYIGTGVYEASRAALLVTLAVVAVATLRRSDRESILSSRSCVVASTCSLAAGNLLAVCGSPLLGDWEALAFVGGAVLGAASGVVNVGWGLALSAMEPRRAAVALSGAFAAGSVYAMAMQDAASWMLACAAVVLPVLSGVALVSSLLRHGRGISAVEGGGKRSLGAIPWKTMGLAVLCCIVSAVAELIVPVRFSSEMYSFNACWPFLYLAIFAVVSMLCLLGKRGGLALVWPLFTFLLACGLLAFSSFFYPYPQASGMVLRATQDTLALFLWMYSVDLVRDRRLPRVPVLSLCVVLLTYVSHAPLPPGFSPESSPFGDVAAVSLSFAMALVLLAYTILLLTGRSSDLRKGGTGSTDGRGSLDGGPDLSEWDLTVREREVVSYIVRGYTYPQIAGKLFLSIDTVRFHAKNIYAKLSVHSKAELVELLEGLKDR
ncbi:helix-turn-helix domain-containing protein [Gordonibacter sp. An230]|uniref:helix-turn-helix domain-containing protein n=1 Tax=Gordonibacter sp. An230 TaxID=1965592 RepID=UPI0013A6641C|nr:helix-turn-helix transcriptional regulator [Gordonibacter sp. An230]